MASIKRNIVCMKWGAKFGPQYVNRLYKMVQKNMTLEHRFICFTDDATGIDAGVEIFPLPEVVLENGLPERGWKKLGILKNPLADLEGQALFLDLDVLVVGNIDAFFEAEGEFLIIKDWDFKNYIGNSSVFRFEIGKYADVVEYFEKHGEEVRLEHRNEQAFMSCEMFKKGIIKYWDSEWCVSFKRHCMKPFPINYFVTPELPQNTKILIFHGHPNPEEAYNGYTAKCGLRHTKPVKWMKEYSEF